MIRKPFLVFLWGLTGSTAALAQQSEPTDLRAEDYREIQQLVAAYSYALDTGAANGDMYAGLFTEQGEFASPFDTIRGYADLKAFASGHRGGQGPAYVRNFATNVLIEPAEGGAVGKVYVMVVNIGEGGAESSIFTGGHFEDRYVRTDDGWRFARREFVPSRSGSAEGAH